ncbi:MAG TPA: PASTA domain-containing protein [Fibrobacteraceae bacterium]|nr:PASTA domain-containing protein [Fibrobacteraceae bacterium]
MTKIKSILHAWTQHPSFYAVCFWVVVGTALLLLVDFIVMPIVAGHLSFTSQVPEVVGKTATQAEQALLDRDLKVSWDSVGRYSSKVPAGAVLIQIPTAGRTVKTGRTVHLIASKGQREVTIPELRGKSQRQAEITLGRLGLVVGAMIPGTHPSIPRGVVIRTEPEAGKVVRMGDKVDVVICGGAARVRLHMPNFKGLSLEQATNLADSLGLKLKRVKRKKKTSKLPNTVIAQKPGPGKSLKPGSSISLLVAD